MFLSAAWMSALLAGVVVVFQLCLALGAPWGDYALGGRFPGGRLPVRARLLSLLSAVVMGLITFHYLVMAGVFTPLFDPGVERAINWAVFAFAVVAIAMNAASRSKKERGLWLPFTVIMAIGNLMVAANYVG